MVSTMPAILGNEAKPIQALLPLRHLRRTRPVASRLPGIPPLTCGNLAAVRSVVNDGVLTQVDVSGERLSSSVAVSESAGATNLHFPRIQTRPRMKASLKLKS